MSYIHGMQRHTKNQKKNMTSLNTYRPNENTIKKCINPLNCTGSSINQGNNIWDSYFHGVIIP